LKIGEQLWGFLRVRSRPRIFSPPIVIHTLAWVSAHRKGGGGREGECMTQHRYIIWSSMDKKEGKFYP
jgi:hypothetical protein